MINKDALDWFLSSRWVEDFNKVVNDPADPIIPLRPLSLGVIQEIIRVDKLIERVLVYDPKDKDYDPTKDELGDIIEQGGWAIQALLEAILYEVSNDHQTA